MRNIAHIFATDIRRVRRNAIAIVVLFGVVVLPSFFGWFNVLSSWDPFGNVKSLKVAVANADHGYTSDLFSLKINVGEQVVSNLRANTDLDWAFTSEAQAIAGTKSGEYYAALVLPPSFSRDMMTFLSPGAEPANIDYYTNEKKNALSPKITDEAATEVSTTINSTFTKTLNDVGLALISSLADRAGDEESRAALTRVQTSAQTAATTLDSGAATLEMFSSLLASSKALVSSASSLTDASLTSVGSASNAIGEGASAAHSLESVLTSTNAAISEALNKTSTSYTSLIDQISALDSTFVGQSQQATAVLTSASADVSVRIEQHQKLLDQLKSQAAATSDPKLKAALEQVITDLETAITRQEGLRQRVDDAVTKLSEANSGLGGTRDEVIALAETARAAVNSAYNSYDGALKPRLDQLASSLSEVNTGFGRVGDDLVSAARSLSGGSSSLLAFLTQAEETTATIAADLRDAASRFVALAQALGQAAQSGDFSKVSALIGNNPSVLAGELTSPVGLERIPVYRVDTFGAQMAPFYTVLGLWVGALLLSVLIRTDVSPGTLPARGSFSKTQEYFGRFGIFAVLGILQSSLLYLGLMGFVGVRPVHPFLLLLAGWVMSLVFSLLTYTLVLSFGEAGKALAVFLLVVQISAGGGAYPLSVLPQWFQSMSPWLPVTHATNAVRAAIAGIYEGDYWIALGQLALFLVPALLIGLLLRLPVLKINGNLTRALESTKLM
ncbi:putative membrane protein [Leucobacter luti]|uniref:YhgE/Pip domain-containing protein n=1 Tax=Leucobacter luti TaxID=340320 RepID=UPI00104926D4|nr:YhgE/Pip domain-containing protein [Leucobacter luti]MCW2289161.1 putative membrane protein [Leucobacter luti]TCK46625.1 putative membrane protein [Leucobacter luti]